MMKRLWLLQLFLTPLFIVGAYFFVGWLFGDLIQQTSLESKHIGMLDQALWALVAVPVFYIFSYRKKGTILLTLTIWGTAVMSCYSLYQLGSFMTAAKILKTAGGAMDRSIWLFAIGFFVLATLAEILWIFTSVYLRRSNLDHQFSELMEIERYAKVFNGMKELEDANDLTEFYQKAISKNRSIEKFITRKYKQQKKELSQAF